MAYLVKLTIVWTLFLLLFEMLYKNNTKFMVNRMYLLLSVTIGLLLPVISLPYYTPGIHAMQGFYTTAKKTYPAIALPVQQGMEPVTTQVISTGGQESLAFIIGIIYGAGVLVLLIRYLFELFKVTQLIRRNSAQILYGHKVITTGRTHSPYSFIGYIFLTGTDYLEPKELEYIIRHEAAHNARKHWIDLLMFQLVCMVFWFHPLIWRYRYLLQLQHEYEADTIAANEDLYGYGQFLLHQTLLGGVPSITHSFQFSPIKNRINMLTKKQGFKPGSWKYIMLVPVLLGCTFLMARTAPEVERALQGNQKTFKGNTFTWRESDTLYYDKQKKRAELVSAYAKFKPQVIVSMNDEAVYKNDYLETQATDGNADMVFGDKIVRQFQALRKNTPDSLTYLVDLSIVIDKEGKIVYYDAHFAVDSKILQERKLWDAFYNPDKTAGMIMDKIISKSPIWKPAMIDGKPVNSYVNVRIPGC